MIDYIESLLEEQEEDGADSEGEVLRVEKYGVHARQAGRGAEADARAPRFEEDGTTVQLKESALEEEIGGWVSGVFSMAGQTIGGTRVREGRAVERTAQGLPEEPKGEGGGAVFLDRPDRGGALRTRLRRAAIAAAYRAAPEEASMQGRTAAAGEGLLPDLDAAVQRDARRYDGGFELL